MNGLRIFLGEHGALPCREGIEHLDTAARLSIARGRLRSGDGRLLVSPDAEALFETIAVALLFVSEPVPWCGVLEYFERVRPRATRVHSRMRELVCADVARLHYSNGPSLVVTIAGSHLPERAGWPSFWERPETPLVAAG